MIDFIKKVLPWVMPEKIINLIFKMIINLRNLGSNFNNDEILLRNRSLKNKYKGKRCFIIGNGSSVDKLDLTKLKNEYVFSMNSFIKHKQLEQINPQFHSVIEPFDMMSTYAKDCEFHPNNYYTQIEKAFENLDTILFFQYDCRNYFENNGMFKNNKIFYLKSKSDSRDFPSSDISKPFSFMANSTYNAICCCAYMGFAELYLIGFDADYILKNNRVHFYDEPDVVRSAGAKPYFLSLPKNESNKALAHHLFTYLEGTERVKKYFEPKGVKIFNAGVGGFLDTFERVDFEKLF
jgi:hypothetical protein